MDDMKLQVLSKIIDWLSDRQGMGLKGMMDSEMKPDISEGLPDNVSQMDGKPMPGEMEEDQVEIEEQPPGEGEVMAGGQDKEPSEDELSELEEMMKRKGIPKRA